MANKVPLKFDERKLFLNIPKPNQEELLNLESFGNTSTSSFEPERNIWNDNIISQQKDMKVYNT